MQNSLVVLILGLHPRVYILSSSHLCPWLLKKKKNRMTYVGHPNTIVVAMLQMQLIKKQISYHL